MRIEREYGWAHFSAQYWVKVYRETGRFEQRTKNCRRKRKTNSRTDRKTGLAFTGSTVIRLKSSREISAELQSSCASISERTVRRLLCEQGLNGHIATIEPLLYLKNMRWRLKWAQEHLSWIKQYWERVLWSDEYLFELFMGASKSVLKLS